MRSNSILYHVILFLALSKPCWTVAHCNHNCLPDVVARIALVCRSCGFHSSAFSRPQHWELRAEEMSNKSVFGNAPASAIPDQSNYTSYILSPFNGTKRNRSGSPSLTRSTMFTDRCKNMVRARCNADICWNCEATGTEFCHVVAQVDDVASVPHIEECKVTDCYSIKTCLD